MKIVVVGAGKVGYYLIRTLIDRGHHPSLVEMNPQRCHIIAEEMGILTINGDGTDLAALVDAGADTADVVAAVTGMDEVNLVICQTAKKRLGVKKVLARVNNPKNREVLKNLGVDVAVSGTALIADAIEEEILWQDMRTLLRLDHSKLSLIEVTIPEGAPTSGKTVKELAVNFPSECALVSIIRRDEVIIPRGATVFSAGDTVTALTRHGEENVLRKVLQGRNG